MLGEDVKFITSQVLEIGNTPVVRVAKAVGPAVVGITNKAYARAYDSRKMLWNRVHALG